MEDELNQIAETVDRIAGKSGTIGQHGPRDGELDSAALALIEEAGLRRVATPESAGGWGAELPYLAVILKRLGYHGLRVPLLEDHLAAEILAGHQVEVPPGLLTVASRVNLEVTLVGDGHVVSGSCRKAPWSRTATHVMALAGSGGGRALVLLPISEAKRESGVNLAGEPRDYLTFDVATPQALLTDSALVEEFRSRLLVYRSLAMLGAGERALDLTVTHVSDRKQFGSPLLKKQVVQHYIAEMFGALTAVRAACEAALQSLGAGAGSLPAALATRIEADRMASTVARLSHQLHGAIGFTLEHQLHRFTTRLTSWRQDDMSEADCALELVRLVSDMGGPWAMMTARGSA